MSVSSRLWLPILSLTGFVAIWYLAAGAAESRVLPGPAVVLGVFLEHTASGELPYHVGVTLLRVAVSFFLAMVIGVALGIAMGRSAMLDRLFDSWLLLFLNLPALVTIILCYVWFGLVEAAAVLAVAVNKIPNVVVTLREGARALDPSLTEMAEAFRLPRVKVLRHIVLPQLLPYLMAAARSGLALIWKIVLVVELLGRSSGVGFQLQVYFQLFDVAGILAYAFGFMVIILAIELVFIQPFERWLTRWRKNPL